MSGSEHALQGPDVGRAGLDSGGLLDAAVHVIVVVDERGEIVLVNPAAESLFAHDREELIGETVESSFRSGSAKATAGCAGDSRREHSLAGRASGWIWSRAARIGQRFLAEIDLSRSQTAGGVLITAAISDITQRKSAEVELAQLAARAGPTRQCRPRRP